MTSSHALNAVNGALRVMGIDLADFSQANLEALAVIPTMLWNNVDCDKNTFQGTMVSTFILQARAISGGEQSIPLDHLSKICKLFMEERQNAKAEYRKQLEERRDAMRAKYKKAQA